MMFDKIKNTYFYDIKFINTLIKKEPITKKALLEKLKINNMEFIRSINKKNHKHIEIIDKLYNYFNIEYVYDYNKYNKIILNAISNNYYNTMVNVVEIKELLNYKNILLPYVKLTLLLFEDNDTVLNDVIEYKEMYDFEPFSSLYKYILFRFTKNNHVRLFLDVKSPFKELSLITLGTNAYNANDFTLSLFYIEQAINLLSDKFNINRILDITKIEYSSLIMIENYSKCVVDMNKILGYLYFNKHKDIDIYMYYYFISLIGSNMLDEYIKTSESIKINDINIRYLNYIVNYLILDDKTIEFDDLDNNVLSIVEKIYHKQCSYKKIDNLNIDTHIKRLLYSLVKNK